MPMAGETGLSEPVRAAVDKAIGMIEELIVETAKPKRPSRGKEKLCLGKVVKWGSLAATIYSLYYFRGDMQRYIKMKMM